RRQLEAERLARVRGEDPQTAGVRDDRSATPTWHGLGRKERRNIDQLVECPGANHASIRKERVSRGVRARECGSVRSRRPDAGARRPALQRQDRLAAREPARDARERAWVAEGLEVEDDELRRIVVLPPLEQVVR